MTRLAKLAASIDDGTERAVRQLLEARDLRAKAERLEADAVPYLRTVGYSWRSIHALTPWMAYETLRRRHGGSR